MKILTTHAKIKFRVIFRAVFHGNFRFARKLLSTLFYGLTHKMCVKCGRFKGLSVERVCGSCAYENIIRAIDSK